MKERIRSWMLSAAMAGLLAFSVLAVAQETEPPAPLPEVEKSESDAPPVETPDVEDPMGGNIHITVQGGENVVLHIGSDSFLGAGDHAETVVAIMGSATSEGEVTDAVVSVLGNTRVTGRVGDSAVSVFGNTYVNSKIGGDVVAVMGNVELGPNAEIGGDAVAVGGRLIRDPAAIVHGSAQEVAFLGGVGRFDRLRPWFEQALFLGRPLAIGPGLGWAWAIALGFLGLYVVIALLFPSSVLRCVQTLESHPGESVLASLLMMLLTPIAILLLLITVIGILLIPFIGVGLFFVGLLGKAVILAALGRRLTARLMSPFDHVAVAVLIGGVIVLGLYLVPIVGFIVYKLTELLGVGVVAYTALLAMKTNREERAGPSPAAPTPSAPPTPPAPRRDPFIDSHAREASMGMSESRTSYPGASDASASNVSPGLHEASTSSASTDAGDARSADATSGTAHTSAGEPGIGSRETNAGSQAPPGYASPPPSSTESTSAAAASLPRAGFGIRMGALIIDLVLVGIIVRTFSQNEEFVLVLLAAYGAVMWKLKATTIGGIVCNLQVVRLDGREIDWPTAIVRALSCFLSLAAAGLGFFWIIFDDGRQAWHDKIAGTVVVRVPKGMSLV